MNHIKRDLVEYVEWTLGKIQNRQQVLRVPRGAPRTINDARGRPRYSLSPTSKLVHARSGRPLSLRHMWPENLVAVQPQLWAHLRAISQ